MNNLRQRYANARKAVAQIRAGEWVPRYNGHSKEHITAHRGSLELWLGNGPFFCDIRPGPYFGLIWRHYVWWAAARRLKLEADKKCRAEIPNVPIL